MSQQISGKSSPLISAQHSLQNTSALQRGAERRRERKHAIKHSQQRHTLKVFLLVKDERAGVTQVHTPGERHKTEPPRGQSPTFKNTHFSTGAQTFSNIEANGLGTDSIPFFYRGKICPLTQNITTLQKCCGHRMPYFTAAVRHESIAIIYTSVF